MHYVMYVQTLPHCSGVFHEPSGWSGSFRNVLDYVIPYEMHYEMYDVATMCPKGSGLLLPINTLHFSHMQHTHTLKVE